MHSAIIPAVRFPDSSLKTDSPQVVTLDTSSSGNATTLMLHALGDEFATPGKATVRVLDPDLAFLRLAPMLFLGVNDSDLGETPDILGVLRALLELALAGVSTGCPLTQLSTASSRSSPLTACEHSPISAV
mmetsp:Transcript_59467/g.158226  ORF Transcript_59467/g.158226 Transcript_59467/m.158226 type:complete len:131 (+) Transcript_59467:585-977(+)